jgi:L-iditol 2-dehydrogenase
MVNFRLKKALEAGADAVIDVSKENIYERMFSLTDGLMAQTVIVGPGNSDVIRESLKLVSRGGSLVIFTPTPPEQKFFLSVNDLYFKDINIVTSYSCGPDDTKRALDFIANGLVDVNLLITHRFGIYDTKKGYDITASAKDSLKCMIIFE